MEGLPELAFTESNVELLIHAVASCKQGKEIYALENYGVSDSAIDLWFESGADDLYNNLEKFRNGCKTAVKMLKVMQKFDTETEFYKIAKALAYDAWLNEPEPSSEDLKYLENERKNDAREMQRRRDEF